MGPKNVCTNLEKHSFSANFLLQKLLGQALKQHPSTKNTSQQAQASHLAGHVTVSRSAWNSMAQFVADNGNALTPDGQIYRRNLVSLSDLAVRS